MEIGFNRKSLTLIVGALLVFSTTLAIGQGIVTGSISGTVLDQQQAVVSGAKVTATNAATNQQFTTETNSQGYYALRFLPVGTYTVTIEAPKFSRVKVSDVVVNTNRDTAMGGRTLTIGTAEVVTVEESAPLVESNSIQIASSFSSKKVTELPVNSGIDQLAYLVPGVVPSGDVAFGNSNGASFAANGQRGRSSNFQIDGQGNNDNSVTGPQLGVTNPDTVAEFQVITNYTAEYGRNTGSIVNIVTKSGTNTFHGSLYEFYTSNKFQSLGNEEKSPFNGFCVPGVAPAGRDGIVGNEDDCQAVQKSQFIENRFGGTLGGPILRDKIWAFGSYQGDRAASQGVFNTGANFVVTSAGLATLQAAFPNSPGVQALAAIGPYKPGISFTDTTTTLVGPTGGQVPVEIGRASRRMAQPFSEDEWSLRGDYQLTSKDRVFARFIRQSNIFTNAVGFRAGDRAVGQAADVPAVSKQIAVDWARSWSNNFINQARFSYGKLEVTFEKGDNPNCTVSTPDQCPTDIEFTGRQNGFPLNFYGLATNAPQGRGVNNYQYQDNATWQIGKMTLKFGGEFDHQKSPSPFLPLFNGQFFYANLNGLVANQVTRFRLVDGPFTNNYKENDLAFYLQNDWRVKDNLTLNMGLRWEWQEQAINLLHDNSVAQQTGSSPFWNTSLPLDFTTVPKFDQDLNNFGPVFGFAWSPRIWKGLFGQDKTVIRGGYAIKYDPAFYNLFLNVSTSAPAVNLGDIRTGVIPQLPANAALGTDVRAALLSTIPTNCGTFVCDPRFRSQTQVAPGFRNPYSQTWSFGIQRQIGAKVAAEVRYVGTHGVGQFQTLNGNVALGPIIANGFGNFIPAGLTPCADAGPDGVPGTAANPGDDAPGFGQGYADCNFRNITTRANTGFNIYHGLQSRFDIQNWHGITTNLSYTFSKNIDNVSEVFSTIAGGQGVVGAQNPFDPNRGERGLSGTDYPHVFSMAVNYELPWLRSQQGFVGHVFGGWQLNTIYRYTSGQPWTPVQLKPIINAGGSNCDPSLTISTTFDTCRPFVGNPSAPIDSVGVCLDPAAADGCGLVDYANLLSTAGDVVPVNVSDVRWIVNDAVSAAVFGGPFNGSRRNTVRGQTINNVNFSVYKNTKITERLSLQFQANAYNVFNRQFRGVPDVVLEDVSSDISPLTGQRITTFGNNFANVSGNFNTNANESGIGVRRLIFGLKVIF